MFYFPEGTLYSSHPSVATTPSYFTDTAATRRDDILDTATSRSRDCRAAVGSRYSMLYRGIALIGLIG
jgi:hypothetical protein